MRDTKELLRETRDRVAPPADVLGSLERRRHRREQVRRATAVVVGIAIALVALGGLFALRGEGAKVPVEPIPSDLGIFAEIRGWIAYGDASVPEPGIWALDPANPGAEPVLLKPDRGIPIAWSSDGSKLLIRRAHDPADGRGELLVLDADGTVTHLADTGWYSGGTFTPDGSQVIYGGRGGIYSVPTDGGAPRQFLIADGVYAPALSPDGSRLAFFQGHGDAENSLWVMNMDGTDKRQIVGVEEAGRTPWSLQWSPDGTRLAFSRGGADRSFGVINADGSGLAFVSVDIQPGAGPYWSPDGTQVAFSTGTRRSTSLAFARPDGSELQGFGVGQAGPWNPLDPAASGEEGT